MKILLLGDANSIHIIRWAKSLAQQGLKIGVWSLSKPMHSEFDDLNIYLSHKNIIPSRDSVFGKLKYLSTFYSLKKSIKEFKPDIVHAHFATSYGFLGRYSKFHPLILSVWGSDVFDFPLKNTAFKSILVNNLKAADKILSTSLVMAEETRKYTEKDILVTPFGVDLDVFDQKRHPSCSTEKRVFTIGTIKSLEDKYGINYLIEAFSIFKKRQFSDAFKLLIVGKGSKETELKLLAKRLNIEKYCEFVNAVPHDKVPYYYSMIDVAVFPSVLDSESFGVAAVEASAMSKPVIVSSVGGLNEVVVDGVTGIKVKPKDPNDLAKALEYLYLHTGIREKMGRAGHNRVRELYHWSDNVRQMINIYNETIKENG